MDVQVLHLIILSTRQLTADILTSLILGEVRVTLIGFVLWMDQSAKLIDYCLPCL